MEGNKLTNEAERKYYSSLSIQILDLTYKEQGRGIIVEDGEPVELIEEAGICS